MRKLLIFIPSPRDLLQFHEAIAKIPHDKIWYKYMPYELQPYQQAREYFLQHPEYTHLAICPDDLEVTPKGVERLWEDSKTYDVIGGMCNVEMSDLKSRDPNYALTHNLPTLAREGRVYHWYHKSDTPKNTILQVPWQGTAFLIMARHVVEQIPFNGDSEANNATVSFSYDVGIAHGLANHSVPSFVDTAVFFKHYRLPFGKILNRHDPQIWLDTETGRNYSHGVFEPDLLDVNLAHGIVFGQQKLSVPKDGKIHTLSCSICTASVVGDDFDLMNEQIDHAYGHLIRRPCPGGFANLYWDGVKLFDDYGQLRSKRLK